MAAVRSCVLLLVVLVCFQVAVSKPMFGWLMCDLLCSDEDIVASTASTTESDDLDLDDLFSLDCGECPRPEPVVTPRPAQSISLNLPSIPNGMRMNVTDNNGVLQFVLNAADMAAAGGPAGAAPAAPAGNGTAPANATAAG